VGEGCGFWVWGVPLGECLSCLTLDTTPSLSSTPSSPPKKTQQATVEASILQIAWVGTSLILAIPGGYAVMRAVPHPPGASTAAPHGWQVTVLADHLTTHPLLGVVPSERLAVLAWDEGMLLLAGEDGAAVRAPLQLPMAPVALASAGLFVVAVCDAGLHVFDRTNGVEVQSIDFAHDDAHVNLEHRLPAADDPAGGRIVMAVRGDVFVLEPVSLEQQVRWLGAGWCVRGVASLSVCVEVAGVGGGGCVPPSTRLVVQRYQSVQHPSTPSPQRSVRRSSASALTRRCS